MKVIRWLFDSYPTADRVEMSTDTYFDRSGRRPTFLRKVGRKNERAGDNILKEKMFFVFRFGILVFIEKSIVLPRTNKVVSRSTDSSKA